VPSSFREYGRGWEPEPQGFSSGVSSAFDLPLIPESEWPSRIEERERKGLTFRALGDRLNLPCKNQRSTSYCWIFAATSSVEYLFAQKHNRVQQLSPASVGCKITGFRNVGGWSTRGLRYITEHGVVPQELWPESAISREHDKPDAWARAMQYQVTEWMELESRNFAQLISTLLSGFPVACGFNWWGHATIALDPVIVGGEVCVAHRNSWGNDYGENGYFVLKGSKKHADDGIAPRSMVLT
jgi:hypothetical protein